MRTVYLIKKTKEIGFVQRILFRKGLTWAEGKYYKYFQIGKYGTLIGETLLDKNLLGFFVMNTLSDVESAKKVGFFVKTFNDKLEI